MFYQIIDMTFKQLSALALVFLTGAACAQVGALDPDWKESDAPPAPTYSTAQLVSIEMPHYVSLKFGVDPATINITPDGIVRYVVVAQNASGAGTAMYEAIRCATGEVKTYGRQNQGEAWRMVKEPKWQDFTGNVPSKHAMALARQGACDSRATAANTPADIVKALKK